ncbi:DNA methyltransferase [Microcoleus sp. FACHB-831]|uniref:type ISP restriction/modification enzyme n=1 Tax=Microcoleus sp. FACHB-831 TaxID=2692827 RepID=UPI0016841BD3|nr:type ISP restriction/modification enzyme [Microcoleus sp. FACHB-831]MBD1920313.1 DNA methyltransferase [Microcoleus sp. FACHB-831]
MKKAKIFYFTLQDEQTKEEKLEWFANTKFENIPFGYITPDEKGNWINQTDNDFDELLPLLNKEVKAGKSQAAIFQLFSSGVQTKRDEWVYDFSQDTLIEKIKYLVEVYEERLKHQTKRELDIKWDGDLTRYLESKIHKFFEKSKIVKSLYRPYTKEYLYFDKHFNARTFQLQNIFPYSNVKNSLVWIKAGSDVPFFCLITNCIPDLLPQGGSQCLPLYRYDENGNRIDNITDWGLTQFQTHYNDSSITKEDIFHYTYAVLHNPAYRKKYELNLKREFPQLPFYNNFFQWVQWGKKLMHLHLNYETIKPYNLTRTDATTNKQPKAKLKADKEKGYIDLDGITFLQGIPAIAWDYKLGNRSALEWILDQYKEKKPKDPTIAKLFNTYRFADYKEHVIDLLQRVCTVSVKTMGIIGQMPDE